VSVAGEKPGYWDRAKRELSRADPHLAEIIKSNPRVYLTRRGEAFHTLARSIVGQQISVKAAQSVWDRLVTTAGEVTPGRFQRMAPDELRACGLSQRKAEYVLDLAGRFTSGALQHTQWPQWNDEDIIADLIQVRGIGRWTAEMFLMFNLLRPDVLPMDDLGLRNAINRHYAKRGELSVKRMRAIAAVWAPWRSVATWYLWRSLDPVPVEY
jgi:DNA-3-methyladenine glycosylase II